MKIQKWISGLLVFFFFTNTVFAQVPLSISPAQTFADLKSPAADIHIPAEFGSVQRNSPGSGPMVIHIADAHAHYEAQLQIKNILDYLIRTYSVRLVGVEGASKTLHPEIFRLFSDKTVNASVVDALVKQGELSGAEFLAIQDDSKNAPVWTGVEDKDLYLKDLTAFRSVWNQYETKKDFFEKQKIEIAKLKMRAFSDELRKFDEAENQFADRKLNFIDYGRILQKTASRRLKLDLANPIHQNDFPNLVRVAILSKIETDVQKQSAQIEKEKSILASNLKGFEWKSEGLDRRFFENLYGASRKNKVNLNQFPAFKQWAEYQILKSEIDAPGLFKEIEGLEKRIYDALIRNYEERDLVNRSQSLRLTEKFVRLEVTRDEFEKFQFDGEKEIELLVQEAKQFYALAIKRESALLSNLLKTAREKKLSKVVLVTGGFHTSGIEAILKSQKVSHVTVSPKISNEDKSGNYLRVILDKIPIALATGDVVGPSRLRRLLGYARSLGAAAPDEESDQTRLPSDHYPAELISQTRPTAWQTIKDAFISRLPFLSREKPKEKRLPPAFDGSETAQDTSQGQSLGIVDFTGAPINPLAIANFNADRVGKEAARLELEGEKSEYPTPEGNLVPRFGYKDSFDGVLSKRAAENREAIKKWTADQKAKGRKVMLHFGIGGQGMSNSVQVDYWGEDKNNLVIVIDRLGTSMKQVFDDLAKRGYKPSEIVLDSSSKSGTTDETLIFYQAAFLELIKRLGVEKGIEAEADALAKNFVSFFKEFNSGKEKADLFANVPEEKFNEAFNPVQRELLKEVFDHLVFTTSKNPRDSRLYALVEGMKKIAPIAAFDFSEYTGGRFTENCESAMVTDAWRGIDIDSMVQSLESDAQNYLGEKGNDLEVNSALKAAITTKLIDPSIIVVAVRSPNALSEALQKVQLFPESNGKNNQGAFVVPAVGETELNEKVQKIIDQTGKAPLVIMVDFPEGKYEGLKPLSLNAELASKTPHLRYIKENISPESNARFALWFQEYTIRYGLLSAAKWAIEKGIQLEIPRVGAAGMNLPTVKGESNLFWLLDPQNQPWVEAAKKALVHDLTSRQQGNQMTEAGMIVRYFALEEKLKNGPYEDDYLQFSTSNNNPELEESGAQMLHGLGVKHTSIITSKMSAAVRDQDFLAAIRSVQNLKQNIKNLSAEQFEAVQAKDEPRIALIQKQIEAVYARIHEIYKTVRDFGKEKTKSEELETAAKDLAVYMLLARQGKQPKLFSPIFYTSSPEADILGEFFGFVDYGIGTRDQHANFQHRLNGRDVTSNVLIDVVTPRKTVMHEQDPITTYGLANDYLNGLYPAEVARFFLEQEFKALTGKVGIDGLDDNGNPVKDQRVRRDAAIFRIPDFSSDEGLLSAFRLFARAQFLYEETLKGQQGKNTAEAKSLGISEVYEFLVQHPVVLLGVAAVAAGVTVLFAIQHNERNRAIKNFKFVNDQEKNSANLKLDELRSALRKNKIKGDDVFESGLFSLVTVARNAKELNRLIDLGIRLAGKGINPNKFFFYVIPKVYEQSRRFSDGDIDSILQAFGTAIDEFRGSREDMDEVFNQKFQKLFWTNSSPQEIQAGIGIYLKSVSASSLGEVISEPVAPGQHKNILKFEDIKPGEIAFGRYDKLIPLTVNFARTYGGSKKEYQWLRELADVLEGFTISVGKPEKMPAPYADYERRNKKIVLDKDFVDFLFMTGRKKITMAWLIDLAHHIKYSKPMDDDKTNLICGSKKSLTSIEEKTRLDDTLYIYKIKEKIAKNDTPEGPEVPTVLTERNVLLIISDYLHRGRILDAPRLQRMLRREFGFYGNFPVEKLSELLEKFYETHKDKMISRPVTTRDDIENLRKKLAETANISLADIASKETKTIRYAFKREYMTDPAFKNRLTVWDVEVERQDEVDFGGKTAHTGELMFAPRAVTLENFATGSQGFQALINYNTTKIFTDNLRKNIEALRKLIHREDSVHDKVIDLLGLTTEELTHEASNGNKEAEILMTELTMLRVILDAEGKATVRKQLEAVIEGYAIVLYDLEHYKYKVSGIRDYFNQLGKSLDDLVENIKAKKLNVEKQIELAKTRLDDLRKEEKIILESKPEDEFGLHGKEKKLAGKRKEIEGKIAEIKALDTLEMHYQKEFEEVTLKNANRFLYAARNLVVPPDLDKEIKDNLKLLAKRLGLPVEKLVLAIRSSAVGEDSEEASFAGRQDTYIFQTATPKNIAAEINKGGLLKVDEDGLDNFVTSWVFNQASLFNKRAIDYRFDKGLPTFDNHVEISTLFQRMFLSKYSFIAFSVDRGTAFPSMSMNIHEGQGEMLVSGQESGSKYVVSLDGKTVIVRDKGERNLKVVETDDRMGKRKIPLTADERKEFSVTDEELVKKSAGYFGSIDDFYDEGFVDLEGAYRPKEDQNLKSIPLKGEKGEILKDHRGFNRMDWNIVSTQARPETVYSLQDPSVIKLKKIMVTDAAFEKAERERKVMDFKFIARTEGTAQGEVSWVHDKTNPDELAKVKGKIMVARQSDPDMNSAMLSAKGIVAILGGQNSHTMIVASEYGLVAITGTSEQLSEYLKEGMEVTIDAERGKILLGYDHELKVAGRDFSAREIPDTPYGTARSSTIVASRDKAMFQHPLRNIPSYKGVGLKRMEIDLAFIETYTDALLSYDNMILKEKGGKVTEGTVLDRNEDKALIEFIEEKIKGYNSGRDFYETVIREGILATAEPLNPDDDEVRLRYQQIKNKELRLAVKEITEQIYKEGLGHNTDRLLVSLRILYDAQAPDSLEHKLIEEIMGLLDKRLYVRLDDRKSDEYKNIKGAEKFVKEELNAMKGYRGLSLLLGSPTLKWQLKVMIDVAKLHRHKIAIFAPIVRRPEDFKKLIEKFLEVGKELGISPTELANLVEIGMMTEIPTNSVYMEDYLKVVQDFRDQGIPIRFFTSTGGNDGLQTIYRIDRNTGDAELKNNATAYGPAVIRWNSRIPAQQKKFNKDKIEAMKAAVQVKNRDAAYKYFTEIVEAGYCGNDPSVRGQDEYGRGLSALGYKSVSVVIEAYEKVAKNLAVTDVKELGATAVPRYERFEKEKDFDFEINPAARPDAQNYIKVNIGDILLSLGVHYRLLSDYDAGKLTDEKGQVLAEEVKKLLRAKGYSANEAGVGMKYFHDAVQEKLEEKFVEAQKSGKKLVIGTDDALTSNHIEDGEKFGGMRGLLGGDRYESLEANPDYGFAGLVKNVTRDREFFKRELEIVRELKSAYPDVKAGITLRLVRTFTDINEALAVMKEAGLIKNISLFETPSKHGFRLALKVLEEAGLVKLPVNGKDPVESALAVLEKRSMIRGENRDITDEKMLGLLEKMSIALKISPKKTDLKAIMEKLKEAGFVGGVPQKGDISVGLDVQVTANLFEIKEILDPVRRIQFLSIPDAEELAGEMMALERNNVNNDLISAGDIRYQTKKPIQILATAASNRGISFTLPAEELARTEFTKPEGPEGQKQISASSLGFIEEIENIALSDLKDNFNWNNAKQFTTLEERLFGKPTLQKLVIAIAHALPEYFSRLYMDNDSFQEIPAGAERLLSEPVARFIQDLSDSIRREAELLDKAKIGDEKQGLAYREIVISPDFASRPEGLVTTWTFMRESEKPEISHPLTEPEGYPFVDSVTVEEKYPQSVINLDVKNIPLAKLQELGTDRLLITLPELKALVAAVHDYQTKRKLRSSASSLGDSEITLAAIKNLALKRKWKIDFKEVVSKDDQTIRVEAQKPRLIVDLPQVKKVSGLEVIDAILSAPNVKDKPYFRPITDALRRIKENGLRASEQEMDAHDGSSLGHALYLQDGVDSLLGDLRIDNASKLRQLVITGPVKLKNSTLIGDVRIENLSGKSVDLNEDPYKKQLPNKADGGLMLIDISIRIDVNGVMSVDKDADGASLGIESTKEPRPGIPDSFMKRMANKSRVEKLARLIASGDLNKTRAYLEELKKDLSEWTKFQNELKGLPNKEEATTHAFETGFLVKVDPTDVEGIIRFAGYKSEAKLPAKSAKFMDILRAVKREKNLNTIHDVKGWESQYRLILTPAEFKALNPKASSLGSNETELVFPNPDLVKKMVVDVQNPTTILLHKDVLQPGSPFVQLIIQLLQFVQKAGGFRTISDAAKRGGVRLTIVVPNSKNAEQDVQNVINAIYLSSEGKVTIQREWFSVATSFPYSQYPTFAIGPSSWLAPYNTPLRKMKMMTVPSSIGQSDRSGASLPGNSLSSTGVIAFNSIAPLRFCKEISEIAKEMDQARRESLGLSLGDPKKEALDEFVARNFNFLTVKEAPIAVELRWLAAKSSESKIEINYYPETEQKNRWGFNPCFPQNKNVLWQWIEIKATNASPEDVLKAVVAKTELPEKVRDAFRAFGEQQGISFKVVAAASLGSTDRPTTVLSSGENEKELRKITNESVRSWVREMTAFTGADSIEVIDASDDDRLLEEEVAAGKLIKLPDGNYYANSHPKDVARSEERTFVSTKNLNDKGLNNNWQPSNELKPKVKKLIEGSMAGKKMYVIPYLMGPVGSEFAQVGVEVTDSRYVALNMIRMTKVGKAALDHLGNTDNFLKGVHSTGNLEQIHKDIAENKIDNRYFASFPDDREIWSYGSAYGGNALLGKKFHSLRQAGYDARNEGWLAEHMAIVEIENLKTGEKKYVAAAFPSASGKTNFAMMKPPAALEKDYAVRVVGDDIAWLRVGKDGRLRAINPENGFFGVVPGTNYETNPAAMDSIRGGTKTLFTNVAINEKTGELWWEGKTKTPPADIDGWKDWQGKSIKDRKPEDMNKPWAHLNSRFTTSAVNAPNVSSAFNDPDGVPISAIFWGGKLKDREPLIRQLRNSAEGIYDGLVMGVEATAAADNKVGQFRPDPNAMKPFFSYNEVDYVRHWTEVMARLGDKAPKFFHVNWFRLDSAGKFLWKGFGENLRLVLWALDRAEGKGGAIDTPIGFMPRKEDLNLEGLNIPDANISELLSVDAEVWKKEAVRREEFLKTLDKNRLPVEILSAHNHFVQQVTAASLGKKKAPQDDRRFLTLEVYSLVAAFYGLGSQMDQVLKDLARNPIRNQVQPAKKNSVKKTRASSLGETVEAPKEVAKEETAQTLPATASSGTEQPVVTAPVQTPYDPMEKLLEEPAGFRPRQDNRMSRNVTRGHIIDGRAQKAAQGRGILDRKTSGSHIIDGRAARAKAPKTVDGQIKRADNILELPQKTPVDRNILGRSLGTEDPVDRIAREVGVQLDPNERAIWTTALAKEKIDEAGLRRELESRIIAPVKAPLDYGWGDVLEADGRSLGDVIGTIKEFAGRIVGNEIPALRDYLYNLIFGAELVASASEDESLKNFRSEHAEYSRTLPDAIYAKAHQQQPEFGVLATTSDLYTPEIERQLKLNPKALAVIVFTGALRDLNAFKQTFSGISDRVIIEPASTPEAGSVMNKILTGSALRKLAGNVKQTELARHTSVFAAADILNDLTGLKLATRLVARNQAQLAEFNISRTDFNLFANTVGFLIAKKGGYDALNEDLREGLSRPDGNNWVQFNLGLLGAKIAQLAQEYAGFLAVLRAA